MKTKNKPHFFLMAGIVAVCAVLAVSCNKDEDPSLADLRDDKIEYLEDSLRISDSLSRIGKAGVVNYSIVVVDGSTSTMFSGEDFGRSKKTQTLLSDAIVTIGQFGKTETDTTDESGMVVFSGFFRNAATVTVRKEGFTSMSYVAAVSLQDATPNGSISSVGNVIPVFATTGANTATISGRATIETNLTNRTPELVPDATTVRASIDAMNEDFYYKYLTSGYGYIEEEYEGGIIFVGAILQASYTTGVVGSVTAGNYTITVPAAVDGLPLQLNYSDVGADQTLFQLNGDDQNTVTRRVVFQGNTDVTPAALPASSTVTVDFISFDDAADADAVISANTGTIEKINVIDGGINYNGVPVVQITGGGGTGATADAFIGANGRVTRIDITNAGSGYTTVPTVTLVSGSAATATAALGGTGTVIALKLLTSGAGYTSAPTVDITGGGATTNATGTATVSNGRVTGLTLNTGGVGYDGSAITVTLTGGGATTPATASASFSGRGIGIVNLTSGGVDYTYAPVVTFSAPQLPTGVRPTAVASIDPDTREVTGINVTSNGSGYTSAPTITLTAGSGASTQAYLTGGSVISFKINDEGSNYAYAPTIVIGSSDTGNGSGATATPVMSNGRLVGITVVTGGSGYTSAPSVDVVVGSGAVAHAVVNASGSITSYNVTKGGSGYNGAPRVFINNGTGPVAPGSGATATSTATGGAVTAVTAVLTGSQYEAGNTPSTEVPFSATKGFGFESKPGLKYINDISYGTGTFRQ